MRASSVLLLSALLALACRPGRAPSPTAGAAASDQGGATATIELSALHEQLAPGAETMLFVRFSIAPGWHLYWTNPGDSGLPPELRWSLPAGWSTGPIDWPVPAVKESEAGLSYIHEEELLLAVPLRAPDSAPYGSEAAIFLRADWLACRESCVPGQATARLALPVAAETRVDRGEARAWAEARSRRPEARGDVEVAARIADGELQLQLATGAADLPRRARLLPERGGWLDEASAEGWRLVAGGAELRRPLLAWGEAPPDTLRGLLLDLERPGRALPLAAPLRQEPPPPLPGANQPKG